MTRFTQFLAALLLWLGAALPAHAAVTATFWSHEFGNSFPHAFITLRGIPDAGGAPIDRDFGFTAKSVTPALLFGSVPGTVEPAPANYIASSDAQFSVVLTDAQYTEMLKLLAAWDEKTGDGHYNLNNRNCVHFVKEAARIAGLTALDHPELMKKPRSYLLAVEEANPGRAIKVGMHGKEYLAGLAPVTPTPVTAAPAAQAALTSTTVPAAPPLHVLPPTAKVPAPVF